MKKKIRVLVVDDSSFFRGRISRALEEDAGIEVVGQAADGQEAVEKNRQLRPDLITMDVEMPVMDGIQAVRAIMAEQPTHIIMFSSLTSDGAQATLDALSAGAQDFLTKQIDTGFNSKGGLGEILRDRVLAIAQRPLARRRAAVSPAPAKTTSRGSRLTKGSTELLVIGASTGGPMALQQILTQLPRTFPVPVLVAVHMPSAFTPSFAERLDQLCALKVSEAGQGDALVAGRVLIAPGGMQTLVDGRPQHLRVKLHDAQDQIYKPSVDVTLGSAAAHAGRNVLAVVLTGMGADGREGARLLKQRGATVWTQDEDSCVVYGMPQAIEKAGLSDQVLPLDDIAAALVHEV